MQTNHEIWLNQLLWNKFRIIYGNYELFLKYRVMIETQKLSVFGLGQNRVNRLQLIKSLSDDGMSSVQISNHLNEHGMRSPNGHLHSPKLVWVTLDKYKRILNRLDSYKVVHKSEELCVIPSK